MPISVAGGGLRYVLPVGYRRIASQSDMADVYAKSRVVEGRPVPDVKGPLSLGAVVAVKPFTAEEIDVVAGPNIPAAPGDVESMRPMYVVHLKEIGAHNVRSGLITVAGGKAIRFAYTLTAGNFSTQRTDVIMSRGTQEYVFAFSGPAVDPADESFVLNSVIFR